MDFLISKNLFSKPHKKYFIRTPTSSYRKSSFYKVGGVGYNSKNRSIFYTRLHGHVLYNTQKQLTQPFGAIQTSRGPLPISDLQKKKSENQQSGSGKKTKRNHSIFKNEELLQSFPEYHEPVGSSSDEEPEDDSIKNQIKNEKMNPSVLKSFQNPVFTVQHSLNSDIVQMPKTNLLKRATGQPEAQPGAGKKTNQPKKDYLAGISFV
jgi:hypothetical protein